MARGSVRKGKRQRARERKHRQIRGLCDQIFQSERDLEGLRQNRVKLLKTYAGRHRLSGGEVMPLNVLHRAMKVTAAQIASTSPKVEVNPRRLSALKGVSMLMAARATHRLEELRHANTSQLVLMDAMTAFGVVKSGRKPSDGGIECDGEWIDYGEAYLSRVSPDDFGFDPTARHVAECRFQYHRYRTTPELLLDNKLVTSEQLKNLPRWGEQNSSPDRAEDLGRDRQKAMGEFTEWLDLIDVYVAPGVFGREPMLITLPGGFPAPSECHGYFGVQPLRMIEADVPEGGPYTIYDFNPIPDQVIGTPPAGFWMDLAQVITSLSNHIVESDTTRKSLLLYSQNTVDEGEVAGVLNSQHGDAIGVNNPDDWRDVELSGSTDSAQRALLLYKNLFTEDTNSDLLSGNQISRGGEKTATEVQAQTAALSASIASMESRFYECEDESLRKLVWEDFFQNDFLNVAVTLQAAGVEVDYELTNEMIREADIIDFNFSIKRGSMRRIDDATRARLVAQWSTNNVPIAVQLGQFGVNPMEYLEITSEGIIDRATLERLIPNPELLRQNVEITQAGGAGNVPKIAGANQPGSSGQKNGALTGSSSPNFDIASNTQATVGSQ